MTESMNGFMTGMALHKKSMTGSRVALSCTVFVPSGSKSGPAFGGQGANGKLHELNPPTENKKNDDKQKTKCRGRLAACKELSPHGDSSL